MSEENRLKMKQSETIDCGDQRTLNMLYETLGGPALNKTFYIVGRKSVAEEILHDVFIKLWDKKLVFENIRQAYAWVYRACTNASIDWLRKKSNQTQEFHEEFMEMDSPYSAEDRSTLKQTIEQLIGQMSEKESQVFIYQYIEGLTQNEIVDITGIPKRTLARIQSELKNKIEKIKEGSNA